MKGGRERVLPKSLEVSNGVVNISTDILIYSFFERRQGLVFPILMKDLMLYERWQRERMLGGGWKRSRRWESVYEF